MTKLEFTKLFNYMDRKFAEVDTKLDLKVSSDEFTKLFSYMENKFADIEARLDMKASSKNLDSLIRAVDYLTKRVDDLFQEMTIGFGKIDRHERWIHQIANKIGLKLKY